MANEISIQAALSGSKGGTTVTGTQSNLQTLTGTGLWANTQLIGTSAEQIVFPGDLTTEGITHLWIKNDDPTNYVTIGLDASVTSPFAKLLAGQVMLLPVYQGNPVYYAKANTAACNLKLVAVGT